MKSCDQARRFHLPSIWVSACFYHHYRHARDDDRFVSVPVCVWHRTDSRFCGDAGDRTAGEPVLGRLRFAHDLHLAVVPQGENGVAEYLEINHVSDLEDINIDWMGRRRCVYRHFRVDHARGFGIRDFSAGHRPAGFQPRRRFKGGTVVTARFKQKPGTNDSRSAGQ